MNQRLREAPRHGLPFAHIDLPLIPWYYLLVFPVPEWQRPAGHQAVVKLRKTGGTDRTETAAGAGCRIRRTGMSMLAFFLLFMPLVHGKAYCEEPMGSVIEEMKRTEFNDIRCNEQQKDYFGYVKGRIPVLISAPHGAKHYRTLEKRWKAEDAYTSSLAIELGRLTGAYVIYVKNKAGEDPNNDIQSKYKDFLRKVVQEKGIKFVMDLHGACREQPFKIDVGTIGNSPDTSSCPVYRPIIERAFEGFDGDIFNKKFHAGGRGTITYCARNDLGIEAAQFEINARYRIIESRSDPSVKANEKDILELIGRFEKMILDINDTIGKGS
jgi:hypothetical protein